MVYWYGCYYVMSEVGRSAESNDDDTLLLLQMMILTTITVMTITCDVHGVNPIYNHSSGCDEGDTNKGYLIVPLIRI